MVMRTAGVYELGGSALGLAVIGGALAASSSSLKQWLIQARFAACCQAKNASSNEPTDQRSFCAEHDFGMCDFVHHAVSLAFCTHLHPSDLARLRRCGRSFGVLEPDSILPKLAAMANQEELARHVSLRDFLHPSSARARPISHAIIIEAAFNDALRCGGDLASALRMPDHQGRTPVVSAVQLAMPVALEALLALGAPADEGGENAGFKYWPPLMYAACVDDRKSASLLVAHGASVNSKDRRNSWTPLMVAAANSHLKMMEWLLDRGADPKGTLMSLGVNQHIDDCCEHLNTLRELLTRRSAESNEARRLKRQISPGEDCKIVSTF
eukprot:TRINITY_DN21511_c0_g1_i1.p1 TRINITY_DN21511_c0_g1~~TRINITY_DN21511_c0_g1_i1.p1  ORF type:complete len:350 (+),score=29.43 TRINITY_DN21511_c0_g1_i1:75-1052(+)